MQEEKQEKKREEQAINVTYETLFDILRTEKRREDIQQLQPSFFNDVVRYLKQKKEIIVKQEHESGVETFDEIKKLNIQYENIQKIIKEIYERREKKILLMALNKSRIRASSVPRGFLLPQEQELCDQITLLLDLYRADIVEKIINGKILKEGVSEKDNEGVSEKDNDGVSEIESAADVMHVKFLQETEEFIGPELESYGPFSANTVAAIPANIASIFIESGVAEQIKN